MLYKKRKNRGGLKWRMPQSGGMAGSVSGSHPGQMHASRRKRINQIKRRKEEDADAAKNGVTVIGLRALQYHVVREVLADQRRRQSVAIAPSRAPRLN